MKKHIKVSLVIFALFTKSPFKVHSEPDSILDKRTSYVKKANQVQENIDRSKARFRRIKKALTGTDDGGELNALVEKGRVRKLHVVLGYSNKVVTSEFYFNANYLVLVLKKVCYYSWDQKKGVLDRVRYSSIEREKYYFYKSKVICKESYMIYGSIKKNRNLLDEQEDLLEEARDLLNLVRQS